MHISSGFDDYKGVLSIGIVLNVIDCWYTFVKKTRKVRVHGLHLMPAVCD